MALVIASFIFVITSLMSSATAVISKSPASTNGLGAVNFPISCSAAAQSKFNTAVLLLHSFWYDKSEQAFRAVAVADPACAMAYWGIAMSRWHELWAPPDKDDVRVAAAAVKQAQKIGAKTDRERRFINAIAAFYHSYNLTNEPASAQVYASAMKSLHAAYPADRQASLFYALALIATAPPEDKKFTNQLAAGAILEPIFAEEPNDPGAAHYLIHAYDDPKLASKALHAAQEYAQIAPAVPHALHMPSHTFTDLGMWEDSIASNRASLAAEYRDYPVERLGSSTFDDFHSTDFLEYAYLQAGRVRDAQRLSAQVAAARPMPSDIYDSLEYVLVLSRSVIEREQWQSAARFQTPIVSFSQTQYPFAAAVIDYVRGIGAARSGDAISASLQLQKLDELSAWAKSASYKRLLTYIQIEHASLSGWIAYARGQNPSAVVELRSAIATASIWEQPPPLFVWPIQEQLGELELLLHRPDQAQLAFQASLKENPNRLRSLDGAARAAVELGDRVTAQKYYAAIISSCPHADAGLVELMRAQEFVSPKP
jgi:predicted Zn-dependent protease